MKHLQTFESFINESSKAGRAWSGRIKNIDNLFSWMVSKNILSEEDKKEKGELFYQYYRYYNDGDFPDILVADGLSKYSGDEIIEEALETCIEDFIKKILSKYSGQYNRHDFRIDKFLGDLHTLKGIIDEYDAYGLLNYWSKEINTKNSDFEKLLNGLKPVYDKAQSAVNNEIKKSDIYKEQKWGSPHGKSIRYQKEQMEQDSVWTPALEKDYNAMTTYMDKMSMIISNVIEATQKLKKVI